MTDDLAEHDMAALRECMEIAKREQLQSILDESRPWLDVARLACYRVQCRALQLRPRESPPSAPADKAAQKFRQKLLGAGVSQFHPDPVPALLEAIEAKKEQRKAQRAG